MDDLNLILLVSSLYLVITAVCCGLQRKLPAVGIWVLGYAVFSQLLLTQLKLGLVSPKVPAFLAASGFAVVCLFKDEHARYRLRLAANFLVPICALCLWILMHDTLVGIPTFDTISGLFADQGMTLIGCFCLVAMAGSRTDLEFIIWIILCTLALSNFVAYLQFFDFPPAWDFYKALRPISIMDPTGNYSIAIESLRFPGLAQDPINQGYLTVTFGGFALAFFLMAFRNDKAMRLISSVLFASFCVILFLVRSRSGSALILMLGLLTYIYLPLRYKNAKLSRTMLLLVLGLGVVALIFLGMRRSEEFQVADFSRMGNFSDDARIDIARLALEEIFTSPLVGVGPELFMESYGIVPHNSVLNAGIYYGAIGIVAMVWFWYGLWRVWRWTWRQRIITSYSWMATGGLFGVLGYNLNGMVHNESIITGGIMGIFAASIWLCASYAEQRFENDEALRAPSTARRPASRQIALQHP